MKLVPEEDPLKQYTLFTKYDGSTLSLSMSDGEDTWTGEVTQSGLERQAANSHMAQGEHLASTLSALRGEEGGESEFVYSVTRTPSGSLRLTWKKYLSEDNIKFQLGEASLHPVSSARRSHFDLCEYAIASVSELKRQVMFVKAEKQRLISERASALRRLEESVSLKEDIEKDLFGKFKVVLNDKKAKIFELNKQVELLLDENAQLQQKLKQVPSDKERASASEGEDPKQKEGQQKTLEDTDDEMDIEREGNNRGTPPTGTSSETLEPSYDLLDGDKDKEFSPPVKRQRRKPSRTASGGSVTVPKLTGRKRTARSSKEASPGSSSSKDRSVESDDLLNML